MFTGIIESTVKITRFIKSGSECSLTVENCFGSSISAGDSISVDGVCLTVEKFSPKEMMFFVSAATVKKTIVSSYSPGNVVNLERAMPANGRFDGHIVQGHIDTSGVVAGVKRVEKGIEIKFSFDKKYSPLVVERGSIAVNGISLTCSETGDDFFKVSCIPETLRRTSFFIPPSIGRKVNLEFDIIGKYVSKVLEKGKKDGDISSLLEKM